MKVVILNVFVLVLLFSCKDKDQIPEGIMGIPKMEKVMTDVLMSESFVESYLLLDTTRKRDEWFTSELNKVLAINDITQDEFRKSLTFYKSRPDLFKIIIDTINARALRNRDKVYDMKEKKRLKME